MRGEKISLRAAVTPFGEMNGDTNDEHRVARGASREARLGGAGAFATGGGIGAVARAGVLARAGERRLRGGVRRERRRRLRDERRAARQRAVRDGAVRRRGRSRWGSRRRG
ncbi:MAG: hypothetical protein D3X82_03030 [Candidatus Leucobacter sulfamidivorax]|nr:hypothetical protein [Candidatus Leucobacter sulfamidivorax]